MAFDGLNERVETYHLNNYNILLQTMKRFTTVTVYF